MSDMWSAYMRQRMRTLGATRTFGILMEKWMTVRVNGQTTHISLDKETNWNPKGYSLEKTRAFIEILRDAP